MKKTIITIIFSVMCVATYLILSPTAFADNVASGICGSNLTWTLDSDGLLTVSGEGKMPDDFAGNWGYWDAY